MKNILFILLIPFVAYSQPVKYNLSGLNSVKIEMFDHYNALDVTSKQKIITETKLKLIAAGIKISDNPVAAFQIIIEVNKGAALVEPRILLKLQTLEKVQTFRNVRTESITYYNDVLFNTPLNNLERTIYTIFLDRLLLDFIDHWLKDNKSP